MKNSRVIGPILAIILAIGVAAAVYVSANRKNSTDKANEIAASIVDIKGMIGSEKESFFADPRVIEVMQKNGFRVKVDKVGSREISTRSTNGYDFGFPSGSPAAIALKTKVKANQTFPVFYTPMTIASWTTITPILEKEGIVRKEGDIFYINDMKKLLGLIDAGQRWRDFKDNTSYNTGKSVLIGSTDIRKSNSAAMYLSLASYIANNSNVVDDISTADRIAAKMAPLFLRQGLQESSSAGPFEDYTTMGVGKAPLVVIYESQFLEYQGKRQKPNQEMVLLYPKPTIFTKHIVVPFNDKGAQFGEFLASNPEIQKLAAEYGYRGSDTQLFADSIRKKGLKAPETLMDVIDPPNYEVMERMISSIEKKFNQ